MATPALVTLATAWADVEYTVHEIFLFIFVGVTLTSAVLAGWCYQLSKRRKTNRKCAISLSLSLAAASVLGIGFLLARSRATRGLAGLSLVLMIPVVVTAVVLAIVGRGECAKAPQKYQRGKTMGILTLVFGALFACFLVPALVGGYKGGMAAVRAQSRNAHDGVGVLRFDAMNFVFRQPEAPWRQADVRLISRGSALAFIRPGPIYFTVTANPLGRGFPEDKQQLAELCKGILQSETTSYHIVREGEAQLNNLAAWQTEARATFQGHPFYYVTRVAATNGFGYRLATWGPVEQADGVISCGEQIFAGFELIEHH